MQRKALEELSGGSWDAIRFVHGTVKTDVHNCRAKVTLTGDEAAIYCAEGQLLFMGPWTCLNVEEYPDRIILIYSEGWDMVEIVIRLH